MKQIVEEKRMVLGQEIDLLRNYPKSNRDLGKRLREKTLEDQEVARKFDKRFFDGDRRHGYGGFSYHPRFWQPVIPDFQSHWKLNSTSSVLDVGCAKGFMLHDLVTLIPGIKVIGIDISQYAISHGMASVRRNLKVANAINLPFQDRSFDIVISINTVHNLPLQSCKEALREITRVSSKGSFITVDAYRNIEEKERMMSWNLTAKTILSVDDWKQLFRDIGYKGDFYWFIP